MSDTKNEFEIDGHPDELMCMKWVAWRMSISYQTLSEKVRNGSSEVPAPSVVFGKEGKRPNRRWKRHVINNFIDGVAA